MSSELGDGKLIMVHVMAWFPQATSNTRSQCLPRSMSHISSICHNELINVDKPDKALKAIITKILNKISNWNKIRNILSQI